MRQNEDGALKLELALSQIGARIADAQDRVQKSNALVIESVFILTKAQQDIEQLYAGLDEYLA